MTQFPSTIPPSQQDQVTALLADAKYLYNHGMFTVLAQGEFFKAMLAILVPAVREPLQ